MKRRRGKEEREIGSEREIETEIGIWPQAISARKGVVPERAVWEGMKERYRWGERAYGRRLGA